MNAEIGTIHSGRVCNAKGYGVFVQLETVDVTGLVHVSRLRGNCRELRYERLAELRPGDEMIVEIADIIEEKGDTRYLLSEKLVHERLVLATLPHDQVIRGQVTRKAEYGVFLILPEWHICGLLHFTRMQGSSRNQRMNYLEQLKVGSEVDVFLHSAAISDGTIKVAFSQLEQ